MLVLTRRISEALVVGDGEMTFTILGIKGNQVRIGIKAEKNVSVDREEIYLRKKKEKQMEAVSDSIFVVQGVARNGITEQPKVRGW